VTLEIRATDDPNRFHLHDEITDGKFGEITCDPPDDNDPDDNDPPYWEVGLWSVMGTGKTWTADADSFDQAKQYAHELYEEFAAERRELGKGAGARTARSFPAGGKPGWRRR
jgi:hypothetical protein